MARLEDSTRSDRRCVRTAFRVIETIRGVDIDMPIQTAATFLIIAENEGCTLADIQTRLGMASSTASRNVASLGERHRLGKPGYDLIIAKPDLQDRRRRLHYLTAKGRVILRQIIDAVER
jgi:DNA-binding MarR family transcriptional regulator